MARAKSKNLAARIEGVRWDLWLAVVTIGLLVFGVVMVYSASAAARSPGRILAGQAVWAALGLGAMLLLRRVDYHLYARPGFVYGFLAICIALLFLVFLGPELNGARRWIYFFGLSAQPSELTKIALVIFMAWFLTERAEEGLLGNFWASVAPALVVLGVLSALILKEPDLGTTLMLGTIFVTMLFVAGVPMRHLLAFSPFLLAGAVLMIVKYSWRVERFKVFLDPERDPLGKGYQILQSLIAIGSGGVNGFGFGQSRQKLAFLITPQSDFIFAVIAEELGLVGAATLILAYGFFLWRGYLAGMRAPDKLGELIAVGLTTGIVVQALFNISVAINLLPAKGITLPFVSAGGSSLLVTLAAAGILLNISGQRSEAAAA